MKKRGTGLFIFFLFLRSEGATWRIFGNFSAILTLAQDKKQKPIGQASHFAHRHEEPSLQLLFLSPENIMAQKRFSIPNDTAVPYETQENEQF